MERLPLKDLRSLLDVVREAYRIRPPASWAQHLLQTLPRLIPVEHLVYIDSNQGDPRALTPQVFVGDPPDMVAKVQRQYALVEQEHPLGARAGLRWRGEAARISDYWDRRAFHRGRLYNEVFHPLGVEHQLVCFTGLPRRVQRVALDRTYRNFSEREVLLLELLRPHLAQARENVERVQGLEAALAGACEAVEALDRGIVLLGPDGQVRACTPRAGIWLAQYCGSAPYKGGRLPAPLDSWIRTQQASLACVDDAPGVRRPLVLRRADATLVVRCPSDPERHCLLLEEHRDVRPAVPPHFDLTPREAEVLTWVAQGKTNPEIAIILAIRPKTVSKHLERIFRKLGVETRTAAARMVRAESDQTS